MLNSANTTPFHTFALVRGDISDQIVNLLEEAHEGDDSDLLAFINSNPSLKQCLDEQECDLSNGRINCNKSDSTLLMVILTPLDANGERMRILNDHNVRERLGRYPWGDGNPLSYLRTWSGNPIDYEENIMILIDKLDEGLSEKIRDHDRFENGSFGTLHGILNTEETRFTTLPMAEKLVDDIRAEKNISNEKLDYMNEIDVYLKEMRQIYEKAL